MSLGSDVEGTQCPVALAQGLIGDRWSVLIIRELFMGNHRFEPMQALTGATPQMLATRLKALEALGLLKRQAYQEKPARYEYLLTEMGMDLYPVILALRAWGEKWCKPSEAGPAVQYIHKPCGNDPGLGVVCQSCGTELRLNDLVAKFSPSFAMERDAKLISFKAKRA